MEEVEHLGIVALKKLRKRIDYGIENIDNKIIIDKDTRNLDGKCLEYELNIQKYTLVNVLAIIDDEIRCLNE